MKEIADIIRGVFKRNKQPEGQAADPVEPVRERDREESVFGTGSRRMADDKQMIEIQEKLVMRMINHGDEEEYRPPPPKKPRLRLVK